MPSSRAILADIHNLSLDPSKAWSSLGKNGRLKGTHQSKVEDHEIANVKEDLEVAVLVETMPEILEKEVEPAELKEVVEHVHHVDNVVEHALLDSTEAFESNSADFSEALDSGNEFDSFRPKKKKK
jgi:hypothetical protein